MEDSWQAISGGRQTTKIAVNPPLLLYPVLTRSDSLILQIPGYLRLNGPIISSPHPCMQGPNSVVVAGTKEENTEKYPPDVLELRANFSVYAGLAEPFWVPCDGFVLPTPSCFQPWSGQTGCLNVLRHHSQIMTNVSSQSLGLNPTTPLDPLVSLPAAGHTLHKSWAHSMSALSPQTP